MEMADSASQRCHTYAKLPNGPKTNGLSNVIKAEQTAGSTNTKPDSIKMLALNCPLAPLTQIEMNDAVLHR